LPSSYKDTIRARRTSASVSSGVAEALLSARNAAIDEPFEDRHQPAVAVTLSPLPALSILSPIPTPDATVSENVLTATTSPLVVAGAVPATVSPELAPDLEEASTGMVRRGVQFRPMDLELVADMVHACRKGRVRLGGKLGPSIILRAALDQLADVYEHDRPRFLSIMSKYANRRIGE
jgi:hypothetical protein